MLKLDLARLRQFLQVGIPGPWVASILFQELRMFFPCEAMTLMWRDGGTGAARMLHESASDLSCDLVDARMLNHASLEKRGTILSREDSLMESIVQKLPAAQGLLDRDLQTLVLPFGDNGARTGGLLLHRRPIPSFLPAERAALLQVSVLLSSALNINKSPCQLITSRGHAGMMLLDERLAIHRACIRARKLLRLVQPPRVRSVGEAGDPLMRNLRHHLNDIGESRGSSFVVRNAWGSFEFFLYPFAGAEADAGKLTAVAVYRQEPLLLSVYRGCGKLGLTGRQTDIAMLLIKGLSNDAAASQLEITATTVADHVRKIYRKLGAGNRSELVTALALGARKVDVASTSGGEPRRRATATHLAGGSHG